LTTLPVLFTASGALPLGELRASAVPRLLLIVVVPARDGPPGRLPRLALSGPADPAGA
jgi:hypothetical protein